MRAAREGRVGGRMSRLMGDHEEERWRAITKDGEGASHVVTSNLDSTIMQYKLFCVIPNGKPAFVVNIDETETVADLKDAIKSKLELSLIAIDLTLYQIDLDGSDEPEYIKEAKRLAENPLNLEKLKVVKRLNTIFGSSGPTEENIHILVVLPPGELISSRACR